MNKTTLLTAAGVMALSAGAVNADKLTFYCSAEPDWCELMSNSFEEATGINVEIAQVSSDGFWTDAWMVEPFVMTCWNERTAAQSALGWATAVSYSEGRLFVRIRGADGLPVQGLALEARLGRPSSDAEDRTVTLMGTPDGYSAEALLQPGVWLVDVSTPDQPAYAQQAELFVQGTD